MQFWERMTTIDKRRLASLLLANILVVLTSTTPVFAAVRLARLVSELSWEFANSISGDNGREDTPVPIPNTAVKLSSAKSTWDAGPWEDRSSPENTILYLVVMLKRSHLFPFRTQQLSSLRLKVLGAQAPGRIGSRQNPRWLNGRAPGC
jgi:hypothetical protein